MTSPKRKIQTHLLSRTHDLGIPSPSEPPSELLQPPRLVFLYVRQFLTRWIPEWVVLGVFGRFVDRCWRGCAVQVGRAVREGY